MMCHSVYSEHDNTLGECYSILVFVPITYMSRTKSTSSAKSPPKFHDASCVGVFSET